MSTMRAVVVERFGGPEVLRVADRPVPEPGRAEVRVAVHSCGVCRHDVLTRAGAFPSIRLPVILGHQVAGVVDAVGPGVSQLAPGDRVLSLVYRTCGRCGPCTRGYETLCSQRPRFLGEDVDGGYADYLVADERSWLAMPDAMTMDSGAVLTCTLGTAYHAIVTRGRAMVGESALVTGASGGVGTQALQLLRLMGLHSVAVTRSPAKVAALRAAGADDVVIAPEGDYRDQVKDVLGGAGADLAIDIVGGDGLSETMHSVRPGGRVVVLGNVDGRTMHLNPAYLILKELSLIGTKSITRAELIDLLQLVARGGIDVSPAMRVPLEDAQRAHEDMANGEGAGRTVLTVRTGERGGDDGR